MSDAKLTNNQTARKFGIPKWLRRYQSRYGKGGALALVAAHKQNPAPMLDHGRDRAAGQEADRSGARQDFERAIYNANPPGDFE